MKICGVVAPRERDGWRFTDEALESIAEQLRAGVSVTAPDGTRSVRSFTDVRVTERGVEASVDVEIEPTPAGDRALGYSVSGSIGRALVPPADRAFWEKPDDSG